jgi:hypothetical protein
MSRGAGSTSKFTHWLWLEFTFSQVVGEKASVPCWFLAIITFSCHIVLSMWKLIACHLASSEEASESMNRILRYFMTHY